MNHPVFEEELFDEADYLGEVRKRPVPQQQGEENAHIQD